MTTTRAAQALFTSSLQPSDRPTVEQAVAALRHSLRRHGGSRGCAAVYATEYGEHPDTAPARMRWALGLADQIWSARVAA
jgi:hypothetical protein